MTERQIPYFLHHLRRDRHTGLPVPVINIWSGEQRRGELRPVVRFDPLVDGLAYFTKGQPGQGHPDFFRQHPARQRRSMVLGRCQVCDRKLITDGWLPVGPGIQSHMAALPAHAVALTEPWLCDDCADYASHHCPGLIRRRRGERVEMLRARPGDPRFTMIMSQAWVEGRLEEYTKRVQPVLWVKLLVTDIELAGRAAALVSAEKEAKK